MRKKAQAGLAYISSGDATEAGEWIREFTRHEVEIMVQDSMFYTSSYGSVTTEEMRRLSKHIEERKKVLQKMGYPLVTEKKHSPTSVKKAVKRSSRSVR